MLAPRPLEIFLLVVCAAGDICTGGEQGLSSSQHLNQSDAEIILSAQTALRQYFIEALANLQEYITGLNPFCAVVSGILQGLRSRDLDPLKSLRNGYDSNSNQSAAYRMAAIVCSLQGCSSAQTTLAEWRSFLLTIPHMTDILPPQPIIPHFTPRHLHKANADSFPDAALLLLQHNHLKLTYRLLNDILYNYPFKNHSPDLAMAIDSFIRKLQPPIDAFRPEQTSVGRPDEILSDIIRFLLQRRQDRLLEFETAALLSALSNRENVDHLRDGSTLWELLELVRDDDYPPDVVRAAHELSAAVKNNRLNVAAGSLKGYSLLQKLLGLISQLAGIPTGDPLSGLVHGIYPHVKLRYLSSKGQFFHPQTSSDVAFLLNSFLTVPSPLLLEEVHKIFLLPEFNWQMILRNFDYSKYSKPRSLLIDMLQELLQNASKLPTCHLILLSHFLSNYSKVPICSPYEFDDDMIDEKLGVAMKPLQLLPDLQKKSPPTAAPTPLPKCSNGPPVQLVDPDSIIEIFSKNATTLISDLIRFNPMPVDRYPNKTRAAVLRAVMNNLRTGRNNSWVAESVIQQAMMRVPLNEKANFPPRYLHLCPLEDNKVLISQDGQQHPVVHQEHPTATSHGAPTSATSLESPSTTASSLLIFTATTPLQPSTFLSSLLSRGSRPPSSPFAVVPGTALPITTASVTIAAVSSSSSTSTSTIDALSSSSPSDTTVAVSPTAATALLSHFVKNASDLSAPPSSQQPLPVHTAHDQFSSSFPANPISTPPQSPAVDSQPSSFQNSTP